MRILIAEDDPVFRRLLEEILVKWEYEVVVAHDGNEAFQQLIRAYSGFLNSADQSILFGRHTWR